MSKQNKYLTEGSKWMLSFWIALLFFAIANPWTFKQTNKITIELFGAKKGTIASHDGFPNTKGLVLHSVVFAVLVRLLMTINLPGVNRENYCGVCKKPKSADGYIGV